MRSGVWLFPDAPAARMLEHIEQAESLGLHEIWLGDEGPARDPLAVLAAAAMRTRSIRLAVGVTNPYMRHPASTAVAMMTVNELSAGRAILGIGAGGGVALDPFGIAPRRPLATLRSALRMMRGVIRGEPTDGYAPPANALTAPDLPLYVGSRSPRINRLASECADGAFVAGLPISQMPEVVGWARSVRRIPVAVYVSVAFEPDEVERARPQMVWGLVNASDATLAITGRTRDVFQAAAAALAEGDAEPARRVMSDELLRHMLLWGSPASIGARLAALAREIEPDSIGLSLLEVHVPRALEACAAAFATMRRDLG